MIAILDAYRAGLFKPQFWLTNILSGLIVGVVALPLAMAFAIASGTKPEQGIYTAIVAGLLVSIFGGSRLQIAGPTGAFIVVLSSISAQYGIDGLQIATIMAGFILLFLGIGRLGALIKYIPDPVVVGFTAGIAVIIWVGQWKDFFGLPPVEASHFHHKLFALLQELPQFNPTTTILACLSLIVLLFAPKVHFLKKIPAPLLALVLISSLQCFFNFPDVNTIGKAFGGIPQGLPAFSLPALSLTRVIELIGPAFTIAMLGAIESLLSAVIADGMTGTKHRPNQELIGQGLANIFAPLFGGFAATGAIARTATNVRNGGNSPLAGIVHALTLVFVLLFLAPLARNIPLAVLAAILFIVAWNMSEAKHFILMIRQAPRADVLILLTTFFLTIFADLVIAVNIGVILAMLHFVRRMASSLEIRPLSHQETSQILQEYEKNQLPPDALIYAVNGPFFFAAMESFERALAHTHTDPRAIILYLRGVPFIDITGLQCLREITNRFHQRGVSVFLIGANEQIRRKLKKAGLDDLSENKKHSDNVKQAVASLT